MIAFGSQTVGIATVSYGARGKLGTQIPQISTENVTGCRFSPWRTTERGDEGVIVQQYRAALPPTEVALAATETDRLIVDGITYLITEVLKHPHPAAGCSHVTIMCQREIG